MPVSKNRKDHDAALNRRFHRLIRKKNEVLNMFRAEQMAKLAELKGLDEEE
jgi:hypothetical protein